MILCLVWLRLRVFELVYLVYVDALLRVFYVWIMLAVLLDFACVKVALYCWFGFVGWVVVSWFLIVVLTVFCLVAV